MSDLFRSERAITLSGATMSRRCIESAGKISCNAAVASAAVSPCSARVPVSATSIFTVTAEGISRNSVFQDPEVFASFGLAAELDAHGLGRDEF